MATAMGMFGPGFVWLIRNPLAQDESRRAGDYPFTILCTYIAGSPLPGAHPRAQTRDMNVMNALTGQNRAGAFGDYSGSEESKLSPGAMKSRHVCLGVCTWEHAWIHDHGVTAIGKRKYLDEWWKCIDWKIVEDNAGYRQERASSIGAGGFQNIK